MSHDRSATTARAIALLGQGLSPSVVASALGVTDSRISQLLSDPQVAAEVQKARFENLQQSTEIDSKYNALEGKLLEKLERVLPLITKPRDLLNAINTVNGAKRRGQSAPDTDALQAKIVNLTLPKIVQQHFITNINQQVTEVRDESGNSQTLVTADSGSLDGFASKLLEDNRKQRELASEEFGESGEPETSQEGPGESEESQGPTSLADYL